MTVKFVVVALSADRSFKNLFTGGAEHRKMMRHEASAAISKIVCLCADISKFLARHISSPWSIDAILSASNLKEDTLVEYSCLLNQWKKQRALEKGTGLVLFPRTTLAETDGFRAAIKGGEQLMELIHVYTKSFKTEQKIFETIAEQAAVWAAALTDMMDVLSKSDQTKVKRNAIQQVSLASKEQISAILNQLQSTKRLASNVLMELGNCTLYVISCDKNALGFIFLDAPVHIPLTEYSKGSVKIAYIETLTSHKTAIAARLLRWVKTSAKDNGYKSLYVKSFLPNGNFWTKCGFSLGQTEALCSLDPICIDNLVNKA